MAFANSALINGNALAITTCYAFCFLNSFVFPGKIVEGPLKVPDEDCTFYNLPSSISKDEERCNKCQEETRPKLSIQLQSILKKYQSTANKFSQTKKASIIKRINAIFQFNIIDKNKDPIESVFLDFKNDVTVSNFVEGSVDVTLTLTESDLVDLINGKLNKIYAYFAGRIVLEGDLFIAKRLEIALKELSK